MAEERKNVFRELALSVWNFESYRGFIKNRGAKVFGFSALLAGLYLLVNTVFVTVEILGMVSVFREEILPGLPSFVLEDGTLTMDETFELDEPGIYVYINTEDFLTSDEIRDIFYDYDTVIIMDSEGAAIQSDGERQMISYEEILDALGRTRYTEKDLTAAVQQLMPYVYIVMGIVLVFLSLGSIAAFYFRILVVSLIVLVMTKVMHVNLNYGKVFTLSVYTRTIPVLLRLLLGITNIPFPFFWMVDFAISGVYACFALKAIRNGQPPYDGQSGYQPPYNGQSGYQPPYSGQSGYQPPYNGQNGYQPPYNGQNGYQPPYNGQNGYQPPYNNGQSGYQPPYNGQNGYRPPYDGQGGYQPPYNGQNGYRPPYSGQNGYQPPYNNGQNGYQPPYSGQGNMPRPGDETGQDRDR